MTGIMALISNLLLEVVVAYAIYSVCVDVGLSLAAFHSSISLRGLHHSHQKG